MAPAHTSVAQAQDYREPNTNADVPQNQHTYVQTMTIELLATGLCQLTGIDVFNPRQGCLGIDPTTKKIGYAKPQDGTPKLGGLLGMVTSSTGTLYIPPASGIDYTRNIARNFGIVKPAVAQIHTPVQPEPYTGFTALQPVQYVWTAIRNLVYSFFVIVFVLIGMGIMLRVKVNAQTVMSIQNQIPKITIAIVMITLSYAIVGFMIDLMWVSTYFVINTLSPAITVSGDSNAQTVQQMATMNLYNNPLNYFNDLFDVTQGDKTTNMMGEMSRDIGMTIGDVVSKIIFSVIDVNAAGISCNGPLDIGNCATAAVYNIIRVLVGVLGMLIIAIALLVAGVRTWFMLIKSYLYVILYTIVGPIYIFMGIMPGSSLGFTNWLRAITANLLVFPAVIGLYLLARFFAVSNSPFTAQNDINTQYNPFLPPLISNPSLLNNVGLLMAFGLVMLTPELITIIRDMLKAKPNPYVAPAVQKGFGVGAGAATALTGAVIGRSLAVKGGVPIGWAASRIHNAGLADHNKPSNPLIRTVTAPLRFALGTKSDGKH